MKLAVVLRGGFGGRCGFWSGRWGGVRRGFGGEGVGPVDPAVGGGARDIVVLPGGPGSREGLFDGGAYDARVGAVGECHGFT